MVLLATCSTSCASTARCNTVLRVDLTVSGVVGTISCGGSSGLGLAFDAGLRVKSHVRGKYFSWVVEMLEEGWSEEVRSNEVVEGRVKQWRVVNGGCFSTGEYNSVHFTLGWNVRRGGISPA